MKRRQPSPREKLKYHFNNRQRITEKIQRLDKPEEYVTNRFFPFNIIQLFWGGLLYLAKCVWYELYYFSPYVVYIAFAGLVWSFFTGSGVAYWLILLCISFFMKMNILLGSYAYVDSRFAETILMTGDQEKRYAKSNQRKIYDLFGDTYSWKSSRDVCDICVNSVPCIDDMVYFIHPYLLVEPRTKFAEFFSISNESWKVVDHLYLPSDFDSDSVKGPMGIFLSALSGALSSLKACSEEIEFSGSKIKKKRVVGKSKKGNITIATRYYLESPSNKVSEYKDALTEKLGKPFETMHDRLYWYVNNQSVVMYAKYGKVIVIIYNIDRCIAFYDRVWGIIEQIILNEKENEANKKPVI